MTTELPEELAERLMRSAPTIEDGEELLYIVDHDVALHADEILAYVQRELELAPRNLARPRQPEIVAALPLDLIAATMDGKPMRWRRGTELTWRVVGPPNQPDALEALRVAFGRAADEWTEAGRPFDGPRFVEVDSNPALRVSLETLPAGTLALAFFPHDRPRKRVVRVAPRVLEAGLTYDRVGVLRHEIGHVLGFRHEHIHADFVAGGGSGSDEEANARVEGGKTMGAEPLGAYDARSVMHYPMGGAGTRDFRITAEDHAAYARLYARSEEDVTEFALDEGVHGQESALRSAALDETDGARGGGSE